MPWLNTDRVGLGGVEPGARPVVIEGDLARPVRPGVSVPLDLTFVNPNDFPVVADELVVKLVDVTAPRGSQSLPCGVGDFAVRQADGLVLRIAAHQSTTLSGQLVSRDSWPQISMLNLTTNQDGCRGATLDLTYSVSGRQVSR